MSRSKIRVKALKGAEVSLKQCVDRVRLFQGKIDGGIKKENSDEMETRRDEKREEESKEKKTLHILHVSLLMWE